MDSDLVALEKDPLSTEILARIFRTVHTIKGSSSFLGLSKLESVAHSCENLLSPLRERETDLTSQITSALLATVDAIRQMLSNIVTMQNEADADYTDLIETLTSFNQGAAVPATEEKIVQAEPPTASTNDLTRAKISESKIRVDVGLLDRLMNLAGELGLYWAVLNNPLIS